MKDKTKIDFTLLILVIASVLILFRGGLNKKTKVFISQKKFAAQHPSSGKKQIQNAPIRKLSSIAPTVNGQFRVPERTFKVTTVKPNNLIKQTYPSYQNVAHVEIFQAETDQETIDDFNFLSTIEKQEREFLIAEVGLSEENYHTVLHQQELTSNQIKNVSKLAKTLGISEQSLKQQILKKHSQWMQANLGLGNYHLLQEISQNQ